MEKIKLYTRDGRFVVEVEIPLFTPMAEVLMWGSRVFILRDDGKYYEGMIWPAIPGVTYPKPEAQKDDAT